MAARRRSRRRYKAGSVVSSRLGCGLYRRDAGWRGILIGVVRRGDCYLARVGCLDGRSFVPRHGWTEGFRYGTGRCVLLPGFRMNWIFRRVFFSVNIGTGARECSDRNGVDMFSSVENIVSLHFCVWIHRWFYFETRLLRSTTGLQLCRRIEGTYLSRWIEVWRDSFFIRKTRSCRS